MISNKIEFVNLEKVSVWFGTGILVNWEGIERSKDVKGDNHVLYVGGAYPEKGLNIEYVDTVLNFYETDAGGKSVHGAPAGFRFEGLTLLHLAIFSQSWQMVVDYIIQEARTPEQLILKAALEQMIADSQRDRKEVTNGPGGAGGG